MYNIRSVRIYMCIRYEIIAYNKLLHLCDITKAAREHQQTTALLSLHHNYQSKNRAATMH